MTRAVPILAALAVLVAIARLSRRPLVNLPSSGQAPDDSEVVGMPSRWPMTVTTAQMDETQSWHPFDAANTYTLRGKRYCRACSAANQRAYQGRKAMALHG